MEIMAILNSRFEKILALLIALGLLGALAASRLRERVEQGNNRVEIVLDGREILHLSEISGKSPATVAATLRRAGATTLAADEATLKDLEAEGLIAFSPPWFWQDRSQIVSKDKALLLTLAKALKMRFPAIQLGAPAKPVLKSQYYLGSKEELAKYSETGLFLDPAQVNAARGGGLRLAARLANMATAQPKALTFSLETAQRAGAGLLIFDQEEVLGYDGLIDYTAREMRRLGLRYGWVELAEQRGEDEMRDKMWDRMLRVHGISDKELPRLKLETVISRMLRAARERDIRVCYTRLFLRPEPDVLAYNADFIAQIASGLKAEGLTLGAAQPYPPVKVPLWANLLMQLGIAAAGALLAGRLLPLRVLGRIIILVLLLGFLVGLFMAKPLLGRQAAGLFAGLSFSTLGVILAWQKLSLGVLESKGPGVESLKSGSCFLKAVGWTLFIGLISLIGGLFISGMLTDTHFIVGAEQFRGVKLLLVGPLLLVMLAVGAGLERPLLSPRQWRNQVASRIRAFFCRPALVIELALVLVALAAVGILIVRSGNAAATTAPVVETQARAGLENLLWARPRTKEFLLATPALFLYFWFCLRRRPRGAGGDELCRPSGWREALLLIGVIGQASIADTFCHLHTPLLLSLARTLNGLWLGLLVGMLLLFAGGIVQTVLSRGKTAPSPLEP
jgi:hypothetical protein